MARLEQHHVALLCVHAQLFCKNARVLGAEYAEFIACLRGNVLRGRAVAVEHVQIGLSGDLADLLVQGIAHVTELQHIAEHRNTSALAGVVRQHAERRLHRSRACVVAVCNDSLSVFL